MYFTNLVSYLTHPWDAFVLLEAFIIRSKDDDYKRLFSNVTFIILKPDYQSNHRHYPINRLRNLAIKAVKTSHYLMIDTDFIPKAGFYEQEVRRLTLWHQKYNIERTTVNPFVASNDLLQMNAVESAKWVERWNDEILLASSSPKISQYAFVVPCFALRVTYQGRYPKDMTEVQDLFHSNDAYITDPYVGHGITKYGIFSEPLLASHTSEGFMGQQQRRVPLSTAEYYHVCFESQWEPYYVLPTFSSPMYDERFRNQGGDKQSHALFLNACGFYFLVLRDAFIFHLDHTPDLAWPGESFQRKARKIFTAGSKSRIQSECSWPDLDQMEQDQKQVQKQRLWLGKQGQIDYFADYIAWLNGKRGTKNKSTLFGLFDDVRMNVKTCPVDPLLSLEQRYLVQF